MNEAEVKKKIKGQEIYEIPNNYIVFDLETTGLKASEEKIIEIGAIKVENGEIIGTFEELVNPEKDINPNITGITHITNDMVEGKRTISEVLPDFLSFIGDYTLIGHNVKFDLSFLWQNIRELGLERMTNDYLDTMKISKILLPNLPGYSLSNLTKYYGIDENGHHRALRDVEMTREVLEKLRNEKIYEQVWDN